MKMSSNVDYAQGVLHQKAAEFLPEYCYMDNEALLDQERYLEELQSKVMLSLVDALNKSHGTDHSLRYWQIIVGPWLRAYIYALYRRYHLLEKLSAKMPRAVIDCLPESQFSVPRDAIDFIQLLKEDRYNLQLHTQILEKDSLGYSKKYLHLAEKDLSTEDLNVASERPLSFYWRFLFSCLKRRRKLLLFAPYFLRKNRLLFVLKSLGRLIEAPNNVFAFSCPGGDDPAVRKQAASQVAWKSENTFEALLLDLLVEAMPLCYLERYASYVSKANEVLKLFGHVSGIFSANGWHQNEVFKFYSALMVERGTRLYGVQHGGNYGNVLINGDYSHELSIVDRYFTWGWSSNNVRVPHYPMPANKLMGSSCHVMKATQKDIVFGLTAFPRFDNTYFVLPPWQFAEYLEAQLGFIDALPDVLKVELHVRPHHEDMGWNIKQRLVRAYPSIQFEGWARPFMKRLETARLYVCDHLSTTHLEALALNMPTILYWQEDLFPLNDEAKLYYHRLRDVEILYDNPVDAANKVAEVYDSIETWWYDPERQQVVRDFVAYYVRIKQGAFNTWYSTLTALV